MAALCCWSSQTAGKCWDQAVQTPNPVFFSCSMLVRAQPMRSKVLSAVSPWLTAARLHLVLWRDVVGRVLPCDEICCPLLVNCQDVLVACFLWTFISIFLVQRGSAEWPVLREARNGCVGHVRTTSENIKKVGLDLWHNAPVV